MAPRNSYDVEAFLAEYQDALTSYDAVRSAAQWGTPATMITDRFVGTLRSREEMAQGLAQAYPLYKSFGLTRIEHTIIERIDVTKRIIRVRVRWHFFADDELLTDSDYEYTLRKDDDGIHAYVAVAIDEEEKLRELADRKGIQLPTIS
ncbi:hypothetical protein [Arthrobacter sp. 2MCAF14]|uniref:hypothetical protein n=1 Tax=Arthrobacter sp. 2MCAF14 TaxID=3232982 RepID=UPI003F93EF26